MKGIIALHGHRSKRAYNLRVQKPKKIKKKRFCFSCGVELIFEHGLALRCGNQRKKTGCAYRAYLDKAKEWKKRVKYNQRPHRKIKILEYGRKYEKKRIRIRRNK